MDALRSYSLLTVKSVSEDRRIITGMASTPETDRVGDIVEPMGAQFKNPMPLLWMHQHDMPVGTVVFGQPTAKGIPFEARLPTVTGPSQLKARIDEAWESVKAGLIRAVSIGFRALEYAVIEETGGMRFTKTDIYELSLVTVPACAGATIETIKSYDAEVLAAIGKERTVAPVGKPNSGASEKPIVVKLTPKEGKQTMNVLDQIQSFQTERAAKVEKMAELMTASGDESFAGDTATAYDALTAEVEAIDKHLARLGTLQKAQSFKAVPVQAVKTEKQALEVRQSQPMTEVRVKQTEEKGIAFARYAKCIGLASRVHMNAIDLAEKLYPEDPRIANVVKATVAAGTTTGTTWASPLVGDETTVFADFVEFLRPMTILGKFGTQGVPSLRRVPFRVPLVGQSSGGEGFWVGEGKAKPLTKFDFSRTTLEPLKVANIAVLTEELIRDSSPSAELIVRDQLAAALRARLDTDFIDPTKASSAGTSPASITYGVSPITSSGNTADDVRIDMKAVFGQFIAANNAPTNGVWIMSATTALALSLMVNSLGQPEFPGVSMNGGTLQGLPVIVSEYVPSDSDGSIVALVNASDIYLGDEGGVMVDMSRETSLEMANPTTSNTGTPTVASLVSMFQTNSVAFRAERTINWAARRSSAVALVDSVNWGSAV